MLRLIKTQNCPLICLGKGKYYKEDGHLTLDVGPFAAGFLFLFIYVDIY